jgi:hypothetical protein
MKIFLSGLWGFSSPCCLSVAYWWLHLYKATSLNGEGRLLKVFMMMHKSIKKTINCSRMGWFEGFKDHFTQETKGYMFAISQAAKLIFLNISES